MRIELLLPGLLWPLDALGNAARDLPLPGLAALLGRGRIDWTRPCHLDDVLARRAGLDAAAAPWAALRLAGEGCDPGAATWLCADPVTLQLARDFFILAGVDQDPPSQDEAEAMVASLNAELGEVGRFFAAAPTRWYLRVEGEVALVTHPPRRVIGRRIDAFLPAGPQAAYWQRVGNEIQVLLHTHPVSEGREAAGLPRINSVWLWGAGRATPSALDAPIWSDDALLRGLGGAVARPLPADLEPVLRQAAAQASVVLDALEGPCLAGDVALWRARLVELDRLWLAPLVDALYAGRIAEIALVAPGDRATLALSLGARDRWRFWRRPKPLAALAPPAATA